MMVCPRLNKSSRPRFALRVASLCSKALSISIEVSEAPLAALALVVNFVCSNSSLSRSNRSFSYCFACMLWNEDCKCLTSYLSCSTRILEFCRRTGGSFCTRTSSLSQLLKICSILAVISRLFATEILDHIGWKQSKQEYLVLQIIFYLLRDIICPMTCFILTKSFLKKVETC